MMKENKKRILNKATLIKLIDNGNVIETHHVQGTHVLYLVRDCPHTHSKYAIVSEYPPTGSVGIVCQEDSLDVIIDKFTCICISCDGIVSAYCDTIDAVYKYYGMPSNTWHTDIQAHSPGWQESQEYREDR